VEARRIAEVEGIIMRRWVGGIVLSTLSVAPCFAGDISPQANRELLAANAKKAGVIVLPSGCNIASSRPETAKRRQPTTP
jgi:hypothetical protein